MCVLATVDDSLHAMNQQGFDTILGSDHFSCRPKARKIGARFVDAKRNESVNTGSQGRTVPKPQKFKHI
jgi:hypothetical protein